MELSSCIPRVSLPPVHVQVFELMRKQEEVRLAEEKTRQSELDVHRGQQEAVSQWVDAAALHTVQRTGKERQRFRVPQTLNPDSSFPGGASEAAGGGE